MNWFFIFFFVSGFCSVLYELVWLRLSMAQFGVTTAMVSIVLSVFMGGLGLGSWASGHFLRESSVARKFSALRIYALTELLIGVSGFLVPYGLIWGHRLLENSGQSSSLAYYMIAGTWVGLVLLPGCTLMGATVPVAMGAIGQRLPDESRRSFSYLYMANVAGAVAGTTIPLFLVELYGFRGTLRVGIACNTLIAISAFVLSKAVAQPEPFKKLNTGITIPAIAAPNSGRMLALLFLSGLTSMAMEVIWVRSYTPYFGTMVYAFASILGVYLLATLIGSMAYRRWSERQIRESPVIWSLLAFCALLPLIMAGPDIKLSKLPRLVLGIAPFTGLLGFITPMLVDRVSGGNPARAGTAYATNIVGCILGPLLAGFGLLPLLSERWSLVVLTLPWLAVGLAQLRPAIELENRRRIVIAACVVLSAIVITFGRGYEEKYPHRTVLRDPTATVIATGEGMDKELLVNGYGMTNLTTITKLMAHVPLASLDRPPQDALVICFGMGTTFRALRSWGIAVTAVELVPSVPRLFSYYHQDGAEVLASPLSHVVIDDGRRFLERTSEQFDVITIDPPPPLEAAGSSLLYSEEFYQVARRKLRPGGILQQWLPASDADREDLTAMVSSLHNSFPYVRAFLDEFGFHFLCSDHPVPTRSSTDMLKRMPPKAILDLAEWEAPEDNPARAAYLRLTSLLSREVSVSNLMMASPDTPPLSDDRPITEYFVLRRWSGSRKGFLNY